jgi:hypothetical protein
MYVYKSECATSVYDHVTLDMLTPSFQSPISCDSIQWTMLLRTTLRPRTLRLAAYRPIRLKSSALISIKNGTFYKQYPTTQDLSNPPLFPNLNFTLPAKRSSAVKAPLQHWAVTGPSERTDLLHILRGQHICIPPDARSYPYLLTKEVADKDPRLRSVSNAIQYIGFSGEGSEAIGGTRGAYLSARYESHREETDWTVQQYLRGQTSLNPMEGEENGTIHDEEFLSQIITDLHLGNLLDMPVQNLSNGQTRRARIAKALLRKPELLLLDEPFSKCCRSSFEHIVSLTSRQWDWTPPQSGAFLGFCINSLRSAPRV